MGIHNNFERMFTTILEIICKMGNFVKLLARLSSYSFINQKTTNEFNFFLEPVLQNYFIFMSTLSTEIICFVLLFPQDE